MQYFNYAPRTRIEVICQHVWKMKGHRPCMLITSRSPIGECAARSHTYTLVHNMEREKNARRTQRSFRNARIYEFDGVYSTHIDFHFHATSTNPMERNHLAKCCRLVLLQAKECSAAFLYVIEFSSLRSGICSWRFFLPQMCRQLRNTAHRIYPNEILILMVLSQFRLKKRHFEFFF